MGRFLPPDHSRGDESTIGGYMAVHSRPAAFEGSDGMSYSVGVETDETGEPGAPWGGYLLFVRWSPGDPSPSGHLETGFLVRGTSEAEVRTAIGALSLDRVKEELDRLIGSSTSAPGRPWWEAMRDDDSGAGPA